MAYEPTQEALSNLKLLLGISPDDTTKDSLLELTLKITGDKVLNETRQIVVPTMLENLIIEMSADAYRLNVQGNGESTAGEIVGSVSSVSDNGQSVSYRDSSYQTVLVAVSKILKDYKSQMDRWRKPGW